MKKVVFNNTNLGENEIEKRVTKVRAIIINEKGQALVGQFSDGAYIFPGGKIDDGELKEEALQREIFEETGIQIDISKIGTPFLEISAYNANYPDPKMGREVNKFTKTIFYEIHTDKQVEQTGQYLSEREKKSRFNVKPMNLSILQYWAETNNPVDYRQKVFNQELLTVTREYARYKQEENAIKNER